MTSGALLGLPPAFWQDSKLTKGDELRLQIMESLLEECGFVLLKRRQIVMATAEFLTGNMAIFYPYEVADRNRRVYGLLKQFEEEKSDGSCHADGDLQEFEGETATEMESSTCKRRGFFLPKGYRSSHGDKREWRISMLEAKLRVAREQVKELQMENEQLRSLIHAQKSIDQRVHEIGHAAIDDVHDDVPWWRILRLHFLASWNNLKSFIKDGRRNGFRYPDQLNSVYVLFSLAGQFWYNIFHKLFAFPGLTMVKHLRKQLKACYNADASLLDGTQENISRILMEQEFRADKRCVVSIDATAIKVNIGLRADGSVTGCVFPMKLNEEQATQILASQEKFREFEDANSGNVAKAVFVVLVNPLDPEVPEFPVAVLPYKQGQMDDIMLDRLRRVNESVRRLGFDVVGNGFDGDSKFLSFSVTLCEAISRTLFPSIGVRIETFFTRLGEELDILSFSDPNHQAKCDRYRRVVGDSVQVFFEKGAPIFDKDDLKLLNVPEYVLSDSAIRKMDDILPRLIFNVPNLLSAVENGRIDLFIALFPTTALITCVMDPNLTRTDRITMLVDAFAVLYLYYVAMNEYRPSQECHISIKRNKRDIICPWHREFTQRYLSTVYLIVKTLLDPRAVNLGALGSHHCENFFGNIRRMGNDDQSLESFLSTCEKAILLKKLCRLIGIKTIKQTNRESMSGAHLTYERYGSESLVGDHLCRAMSLWRLVADYGTTPYTTYVQQSLQAFSKSPCTWTQPAEALELIPVALRTRQEATGTHSRSARKARQVATSGAKCQERWTSAQQFHDSIKPQ